MLTNSIKWQKLTKLREFICWCPCIYCQLCLCQTFVHFLSSQCLIMCVCIIVLTQYYNFKVTPEKSSHTIYIHKWLFTLLFFLFPVISCSSSLSFFSNSHTNNIWCTCDALIINSNATAELPNAFSYNTMVNKACNIISRCINIYSLFLSHMHYLFGFKPGKEDKREICIPRNANKLFKVTDTIFIYFIYYISITRVREFDYTT